MFPYDTGNLIRCECGHAAAQHTDSGCTVAACDCMKSPTAIVIDEIELLRPEWLAPKKSNSRT
jgi:hypothetical protein